MTLGDCIKEYRKEQGLSQRQFAERCGLSNAYISILEKNINPKTKEAPAASPGVYKAIATVMGITAEQLMEKADESAVDLGPNMMLVTGAMNLPIHKDIIAMLERRIKPSEDAKEAELLYLFGSMSSTDQDKLLDYARYIVSSNRRKK